MRKIFELYAEGLGYQKICNELIRLGCKNASGKIQWSVERIGRILRNATYKGYICYNKSHSNNFLEQKRINHRDEEFVCVKGDFEPIVSEELWDRCREIRLRKSAAQRDENGKTRKFGRKEPQSVWSDLLRCSCGSSFARFLWRTNEDGKKIYGYECYRQKRSATASYLRKHGLDESIVCEEKSIPGWHLDLMAYIIF
ncbi:MAG: recombinase family protein, partial [Oscillospiraceae bacterium]|nr:recombinase family protein [Oscillospiraceae bacterium]